MGTISMSGTELDRFELMRRLDRKELRQTDVAGLIGLSVRQVQRLLARFRRDGAAGLVSKKRGRPSNRRLPDALRTQAMDLVRAHYHDFGPTLACEKLDARHGIRVSVETVRTWMIESGLWVPRKLRERQVFQPRQRRACRGELVQIDGCEHDWFEGRGPKCSLLVYVDDATSEIVQMRFVRSESTFDYFEATKAYLKVHGRPVAFYSDRHSIFTKAKKRAKEFGGLTQFGRALQSLNIDILCAPTPQAKGRVERAHLTLQDRLVKELRLEGINTMDEANAFVPTYIAMHNAKFARVPKSTVDAHRPLRPEDDLEHVFCWREQRKLSSQLVLHYKRVMYLVEKTDENRVLRNKRVEVLEWPDGEVELWYDGRKLEHAVFDKNPHVTGEVVAHKRLGHILRYCQDMQRERDEELLKSSKLTLREKDRIRERRPT